MVSKSVLHAIAEAATPAGRRLAAPDGDIADDVYRALEQLLPGTRSAYRAMVRMLDLAAIPMCGRRLSKLPLTRRIEILERLGRDDKMYWLVRAVTAPIKIARARSLEEAPPLLAVAERRRYEERIVDARSFDADEEVEVDAVVVGTGAGGAPIAKKLASRGYAVLMLEEGGHFTRGDFTSDPFEMQQKMYRRGGATIALGNAIIPVPLGRTVGGTTTINSGTCFRLPDRVFHRWQLEDGLLDLGRGSLDAHFDSVEAMLEVAPTPEDVLGGCAHVIRRGCEALGWEHAPLRRNAPGCDGQGVCCFGCPTDAKRSTNVSYVPAALQAGAMVFCHARVTRVLIEKGRAVGVLAHARRPDGTRVRIRVRARSVVLACGAIHTPALLLAQGIANGSGRVGRDLTIHPAGHAFAEFREPILGWPAVPQGYSVDEFVDQGIRFEGGTLPPVMAAAAFGALGSKWTEMVERMDEIATFGFMISDTSRGRVQLGPDGRPMMRYSINDTDLKKMIRAHGLLARMFLAAGAERVHPGMRIFSELRSISDVERLEREGPKRLRPHHLDVAAFHPLGTCRMGRDASSSVVGSSHETHDVPGLFISDGSVVNGPLGVNPQVTIMAMAERASAFVQQRIEETGEVVAVAETPEAQLQFAETMAGTYAVCEGATERELAFTVSARTTPDMARHIRHGGELELHGELTMEGVASKVPCQGRLLIRPLSSTATLIYDLTFRADDGTPLKLHGEKNVRLTSPLSGMTTLYTEVWDGPQIIGRGVLRFDVRDLPAWLRSFRIAAVELSPNEAERREANAA